MILTDKQIKNAIVSGELIIHNFSESCVEPASYDMRVGNQGFTTTARTMVDIKGKGIMILEPGDFGVVTTYEEIELPNDYAARIGVRSSLTRAGIFSATGPQIDPGYKGLFTIGLINLSPNPVTLAYKEQFCTIEFHKLSEPVENPYDGPYQGQRELTSRDIDHLVQHQGMAYSQVLKTLSSLSENVGRLTTDFEIFQKTFNWKFVILGIIFAAAALIAALK